MVKVKRTKFDIKTKKIIEEEIDVTPEPQVVEEKIEIDFVKLKKLVDYAEQRRWI